ncbi:integral membrane protein [Venturia nashicola]|uniref:Integral membrane protein n=1 Tax=Venturia nashicola TaxID=86259 RepID=A0A4Z1NX11_9PEZI|nr:integral membrane protein [Venturia nashicola]TLD29844.1 integral membrane protein [Venturia nashicola]
MFVKPLSLPMTGNARVSLAAISTLWVVFAVTVTFRLLGRLRGMGLGADDALSVMALLLTAAAIGLNVVVYTIGVGYDFNATDPLYPKLVHNLPVIMQVTFSYTLVYIWCLASLKMSQLILYMRVFAVRLSKWVYSIGAIVVVWALVFNFIFIFLCDPIQQQWTVERVGHCLDQMLVLKWLIMTNLVTDLVIVILPMRSVWQLQMRKTERLAIVACFGLGGACVFISLARFIQLYTIDFIGNLTGTSLITFMLCSLELILAGLCINIPMLRPFYIRIRAKYKSSVGSNGSCGLDAHQSSGSRQIREPQNRPEKDMTWLELDDKVPSDDTSSGRRLTSDQSGGEIHVRKDWAISSTRGLPQVRSA